jgi:hypothetical protein
MVKLSVILLTVFVLLFQSDITAACSAGKKPIVFYPDSSVYSLSYGFAEEISIQLKDPLSEIGYCLVPIDSIHQSDTATSLLLFLAVRNRKSDISSIDSTMTGPTTQIIVGLLNSSDTTREELLSSLDHPLVSLSYDPVDPSTIESVLVRKISENLRTQYVCQVRIQSNPDGVLITTGSGLKGETPLEWILPVGKLDIKAELNDYENITKKLDLTEPGIHTYYLQMRKRMFYRSGFMWPAVAFGGLAACLFGAEKFYYSKYQALGRNEYLNTPEAFGKQFYTAKNYERAAFAALSLSGVSLIMSFIF